MLKLKLQYFSHLTWTADSLEKCLMLGKIEGRRRRVSRVRRWDGWMASPMQWTWTWVNFGRRWVRGRPGVLQSMRSQGVGHDWATEQQRQHSMQYLGHQFSSVQFSHSVMSDSLWPHGLQHTRPPCPLISPGVCPSSCPLTQWCYPTILSSVPSFSSCPQCFSASGSFPMSQFFASGGQSIGVSASASVFSMNIQGWLTGLISLQSKGL